MACWRDEHGCWSTTTTGFLPRRYPDEPAVVVAEPVVVYERRRVPVRWHNSRDARAWSRAVKERDGSCVVCGSTDELHAHHVKPRREYPELALDLGNGETRCRAHHREAHPELPDLLFARAA